MQSPLFAVPIDLHYLEFEGMINRTNAHHGKVQDNQGHQKCPSLDFTFLNH